MQQHFDTSPDGSITETSCYETSSEDGGGGSPWFAGGMHSLSTFAKTLGQNLDGFASAVNRGARNLIHELAELENETMGFYDSSVVIPTNRSGTSSEVINTPTTPIGGAAAGDGASDNSSADGKNVLPLPWEICVQQSSDTDNMIMSVEHREDEKLKEKILALGQNENVFTGPFSSNHKVSRSFHLDKARLILIQRLLAIDHNLGRIHAKVSDQREFNEAVFWQNYFYHCDKIREERQMEIIEENRLKAYHDDELDAELVGRPPASCTGFYPRTGKLQDTTYNTQINGHEEETSLDTGDSEEFVMVEKDV